jgi:hypothetical protein
VPDPEVPTDDALEQSQAVDDEVGPPSEALHDIEVPEADALEQSESVPYDDDEFR